MILGKVKGVDEEDRVKLIRRGNELFNQGDIVNSLKIFLATDYKDGIIRVADYFYFDKKDLIKGIKLYKKAGFQKRVDEFAEKAAQIIHLLLEEDKQIQEVQKAVESAVIKEWKPVTIKIEDIANLKPNNNTIEDKNDIGRKDSSES